MAKNGPAASKTKKPVPPSLYYNDSDYGYSSEDMDDPIIGRDSRPTPEIPYGRNGSMRNSPYRPSRWEGWLDCCTRYLTPFALCSMGKNPFMLMGKRKYKRYRVSGDMMDEYLKVRIQQKQESGKLAMMNQNPKPKVADETAIKIE